jgi:uncharacterized protein YdaU (DUF1376 family)
VLAEDYPRSDRFFVTGASEWTQRRRSAEIVRRQNEHARQSRSRSRLVSDSTQNRTVLGSDEAPTARPGRSLQADPLGHQAKCAKTTVLRRYPLWASYVPPHVMSLSSARVVGP